MEQYEYRIVKTHRQDLAEQMLNVLAAEGWRVITSASPYSPYVLWTLERKIMPKSAYRGELF